MRYDFIKVNTGKTKNVLDLLTDRASRGAVLGRCIVDLKEATLEEFALSRDDGFPMAPSLHHLPPISLSPFPKTIVREYLHTTPLGGWTLGERV